MEVSFEVHKIIKLTIHNTVFFISGEVIEEVLMLMLQLVEQIIKDVKSMRISFRVKHP